MVLLIIIIPLVIVALLFLRECNGMSETYKALVEKEEDLQRLKSIQQYENELKKSLE